MEVQLQELIDRIKSEGVGAARTEAERIVADAQAQAASIAAAAEKKAARTLEEAKAEAARAQAAGEAALKQASRNMILALRKSLEAMLAAIARTETVKAMNDDLLARLIPEVVKAWISGGSGDLAVLLPPDSMKKLEAKLHGLLKAELAKGAEIRPFPHLDAGFRIQDRAGSLSWDFSAEELARMLSQFLNPRLAAILEQAAREPGE
jgi:V/A-type H+/Na+-transporting ATPase subunit E